MNIIAYREPGKRLRIFEVRREKCFPPVVNDNCFVVSPFNPDSENLFYSYVSELQSLPEGLVSSNIIPNLSHKIFNKTDYNQYITIIKNFIGSSPDSKIVASRRKVIEYQRTPNEILESLCEQHKNAYVFFISTKELGTWVGASPELLLKRENNTFVSMSLAGTRKAGTKEKWDLKNIKEQQIVTQYIKKTLQKNHLNIIKEKTTTQNAGNVEHISTLIKAELYGTNNFGLTGLLNELAPTPALSGYPKEEALKIIWENEGDRVLYGGYCGEIHSNGDFSLYVILRCAFLESEDKAILFAGGGITCFSDIDSEWEETESKFNTLQRFI